MRGRLERASVRPAVRVRVRGFPQAGRRARRALPHGALAPVRPQPAFVGGAGFDRQAPRPQALGGPAARLPGALSLRARQASSDYVVLKFIFFCKFDTNN